jgi:hypothetical protein
VLGSSTFLFRSSLVEVRSRSPRRLIDGLLAHLGFYADESADGLLAVDAMALVTEDRAYLVPWELRPSLDRLERRLNRAGYAVADERYALLTSTPANSSPVERRWCWTPTHLVALTAPRNARSAASQWSRQVATRLPGGCCSARTPMSPPSTPWR